MDFYHPIYNIAINDDGVTIVHFHMTIIMHAQIQHTYAEATAEKQSAPPKLSSTSVLAFYH